jgi:hypothetical protein
MENMRGRIHPNRLDIWTLRVIYTSNRCCVYQQMLLMTYAFRRVYWRNPHYRLRTRSLCSSCLLTPGSFLFDWAPPGVLVCLRFLGWSRTGCSSLGCYIHLRCCNPCLCMCGIFRIVYPLVSPFKTAFWSPWFLMWVTHRRVLLPVYVCLRQSDTSCWHMLTRHAMYVKRNIEARSRRPSCRRKAMSIS